MERPDDHLPQAPVVRKVFPERGGVVTRHGTRGLGVAVMHLGGNRQAESDVIDHAVGFSAIAGPGEQVGRAGTGSPLAVVHARDEASADAAQRAVRELIEVGDAGPPDVPVVTEVVR
jgi:thymidine phosphorylase